VGGGGDEDRAQWEHGECERERSAWRIKDAAVLPLAPRRGAAPSKKKRRMTRAWLMI